MIMDFFNFLYEKIFGNEMLNAEGKNYHLCSGVTLVINETQALDNITMEEFSGIRTQGDAVLHVNRIYAPHESSYLIGSIYYGELIQEEE